MSEVQQEFFICRDAQFCHIVVDLSYSNIMSSSIEGLFKVRNFKKNESYDCK
jgi:hypothetical protein